MTLAEYSTPDALKAWQDFWPLITLAAGGAFWSWRRWRKWKSDLVKDIREDIREDLFPNLLKQITELIEDKTKPIQPESNGGLSLPDLHKKVDDLADTVADVQREQSNTNAVVLAHIANHRTDQNPERNPDG